MNSRASLTPACPRETRSNGRGGAVPPGRPADEAHFALRERHRDPVRDFYAAMSADYQMVSQEVDGTRVNSYYRSAQEAGGKLALQYAVEALRLFNAEFGPYPYAEFDVVATPTNAGGIEYPGTIVVAQGLYDQPNGFFEWATAHEVAHQWWYGLVGNDQTDEPWLDESLCTYSERLFYEDSYPELVSWWWVYRIDFYKPEGFVDIPIYEGQGFRPYTNAVYFQGAYFLEKVRQRIGDEA